MDEVCDSKTRPTLEVTPNLERAIVLPLEGKGDRSAVDEVKMRTGFPSRSVVSRISLSIALESGITAKLSLALPRGAGEDLLSVGSQCPRRVLC